MNKNNITFHTDDLGITRSSSLDIINAWKMGYLQSFSIIANGDAVEFVERELGKNRDLGVRIAVHLNLTEGKCSSDPSRVPLLVNPNGEFKYSFGSLLFILLFCFPRQRRELCNQIRIEFNSQIKAVKKICTKRTIQSVDGHNHIQMIPFIFKEAVDCARSNDINEIRISNEKFYISSDEYVFFKSYWWINLIKHLLLNLFSICNLYLLKNSGVVSPGRVIGILHSGHMTASSVLNGVKVLRKNESVEVIFHIGQTNVKESIRWRNPSYGNFHISKERALEWKELEKISKIINTTSKNQA